MTKRTFQRTTIFLGLVVLAGLFSALGTDTAEAQCGCGTRYRAVPYQPPAYVYRTWAPPRGCNPYYGAPVYRRQYVLPQAPPQPTPHGPGMAPGGDHSHDASKHQRAAAPEALPAHPPRTHRMAPPEPRSHPAAEAEAVAPPDLPPPVTAKTRTLAEKQQICPVTGQRLGSMGKPYKVRIKGREVLLCCQGCEARLIRDPDKYLAKLNP